MKTIILSAPLALCIASGAYAQSWTGAYAGIAAATNGGEQEYCPCSDDPQYDLTGTNIGAFAGYNHDFGDYIIGGEIAFFGGNIYEEDAEFGDAYKDYRFTDFIDLKLRAGYDAGQFLPYAVLGYTAANWDENGTDYNTDGVIYGIGADYAYNTNFVFGGELTIRKLEEDDFPFEATVSTFALRGAYKF